MPDAHPLTAAITVARTGNIDALRALVDWPLTGAGRLVRAVTDVFERDRSRMLVTGLAELDGVSDRPELVDDLLRDVVPTLAAGRDIRRADPAATQAALAVIRVPALPAGLTDEQRTRLTGIAARAAQVHEVFVVVGEAGDLPVAMAPGNEQLVLVLPDRRVG